MESHSLLEGIALLLCVGVGLAFVVRVIRGSAERKPPRWCVCLYAVGALTCAAGVYSSPSLPQPMPLGLTGSRLVVLGLVEVLVGLLLWVVLTLSPRGPGRTEISDEGVQQRGPRGDIKGMVRWADLQKSWIRTTSLGPFTDDLFRILVGPEGECVIPIGSEGAGHVVKRLAQLPGLDEEAYVAAVGSTEDARFCVWRRPPS